MSRLAKTAHATSRMAMRWTLRAQVFDEVIEGLKAIERVERAMR